MFKPADISLRVCFFAHRTDLSGANRSLLTLLRELGKFIPSDFLHVVLPSRGLFQDEITSLGISTSIINFKYTSQKSKLNWRGKLLEILLFVQDLIKISAINHKKLRECDVIYTNTSVIGHGLILSRFYRKPHIWHIREFQKEAFDMTPIWGSSIQSKLYKASETIIFVSKALKESISEVANNAKLRIVIYNGVLTDSQEFVTRNSKKKDEIKFCYAGEMTQQKNVKECLAIMKSLFDDGVKSYLTVIGTTDTKYGEEFRQLAEQLDLANCIEYTGYISDVRTKFLDAHFLLMPSRFEAMGRVTVEAMSVGLPVIGFNCSGTSELFESGQSGFLYDKITDILNFIKSLTSSKYFEMSKNAKEFAQANYSVEGYGSAIFDTILKTVYNQNLT